MVSALYANHEKFKHVSDFAIKTNLLPLGSGQGIGFYMLAPLSGEGALFLPKSKLVHCYSGILLHFYIIRQ